jgi:superfamily II DNA or RNA helicase
MKELIHQLETSFWRALPKSIPTHLWTGDEKPTFRNGITFATIDSVYGQSGRLNAHEFGMVVVDEAHHAGSGSYQSVITRLDPQLLLGMTATPWRGDGFDITRTFGPSAFTMGIAEGMRRGFLAGVDYRLMTDDIDWEQIPQLSRMGLSISELNRKLFLPQRDEAMLRSVAEHWAQLRAPRAILFCRTIEHAERMAAMMNAAGFAQAACLSSQTNRRDRDVLMSRFRDGRIDVITTVDIFNEGVDVPDVTLIAFMRVTHSRRIFVQQLGRGLRLSDNKVTVRVLDFVSDIRRIAAGMELQREYAAAQTGDIEILSLPERIVSFSRPEAENLFNQWLQDVSSVQDADEQSRLDFPPF